MRNTIFLIAFLICGICFSQNPDRFRDGIRTKLVQPDTLSTTDRDALTPKLGTILYHKDTGVSQWEQWDGTNWVEFGAGLEITGAASTIVTADLPINRAVISNGSGKIAESAVTSTELSYVGGVTSALQTQLNAKLNTSSYTAADVLAKLLTVDGSGSGLDADLLRGVHWGNVNTNILTTGTVRGANNSGINGTSTGTSNIAYLALFESNGTTRQGYIGFGSASNNDLDIYNQVSNKLFKLRSDGVLTYNGNIDITGTGLFSSTVTATNFILSSDKRLKQNIGSLGNGYYSFEFKDKPGEKRYGVIAQEVQEYAPELVSKGEDGYLKVAYIDLLIKKIAELEARVKELEKK